MSRPVFSIIIPTYNRAQYVPLAIESVLAQSFTDWELLVIDDGSTDNSQAVITPYQQDERIYYHRQTNQGRSLARNAGAALAHGTWLIFLDSDDELLPNCLDDHLAAAQSSGAQMVIGGCDLVDADGVLVGVRHPWSTGGELTLSGWLFDCYGQPSAVAVRRDRFIETGGFQKVMEPAEDWKLYLDLAALACPMAWTRAQVCRYRQHATNSIRDIGNHAAASFRVLESAAALTDERERALAWLRAVVANRYLLAGQVATAQEMVQPLLSANEATVALLEKVLSDVPDSERAVQMLRGLGFRPKTIRQARARCSLANYYRSQQRQSLWNAVRFDPRWLRNRGVLSSLLRSLIPRTV